MENRLEQRMFFFVPYNISGIQKGIQAGHCALEYVNKFGQTEEYKNFIKNDKTWIILNGGTTCNVMDKYGTLDEIEKQLYDNGIRYEFFKEPDLNYALTAVCFLADERVWNKEKYPDWIGERNHWERDFDVSPSEDKFGKTISEWSESIGGKKNAFLRELLKDKRLA